MLPPSPHAYPLRVPARFHGQRSAGLARYLVACVRTCADSVQLRSKRVSGVAGTARQRGSAVTHRAAGAGRREKGMERQREGEGEGEGEGESAGSNQLTMMAMVECSGLWSGLWSV